MSFNSLEFAVFLPVVFAMYWFGCGGRVRRQNVLIVVASYAFYGWWDWRFLGLIALSTAIDFAVGRALTGERRPGRRRGLLGVSLAANLGMLGLFKYFDWFVASFAEAFTLFGQPAAAWTLGVVLPVGISFYTFQTLSYTIDVYRGRLAAADDPVAFAAFVSFFPQLVAGPIERATHLLPQFSRRRRFAYAAGVDGLRQVLWGLFKKVVVADNCASYVDVFFADPEAFGGSALALGAVFFAVQIYGDFSGYSDIAIGTARLFDVDLRRNFAYPYFSRDIAEFWRRWHISLSSWFKDYLYIPLGGSRGSRALRVRNTFAVFLVSGLWHGANWTFVVWGVVHAALFLPLLLADANRRHLDLVGGGGLLPSAREAAHMLATFALVTVAWVFFRARDLGHAVDYLAGMASASLLSVPQFGGRPLALAVALACAFCFALEWAGRRAEHPLAAVALAWPRPARLALYLGLATAVLLNAGQRQTFIYFQF